MGGSRARALASEQTIVSCRCRLLNHGRPQAYRELNSWTAGDIGVALLTSFSRLSPRLLLAGSVLFPAALFLGAAWLDYQVTLTRAREYVVTTTNALAEQTAEALQTASVILARTLDRVDGMDGSRRHVAPECMNSSRELITSWPDRQSGHLGDLVWAFKLLHRRGQPLRPTITTDATLRDRGLEESRVKRGSGVGGVGGGSRGYR